MYFDRNLKICFLRNSEAWTEKYSGRFNQFVDLIDSHFDNPKQLKGNKAPSDVNKRYFSTDPR